MPESLMRGLNMLTQNDNRKRVAISARLLTGASLAALGITLAAPALAQTVLSPVQVQGNGTGDYTAANSGLAKLPEPLLDTPISVTTITQQLMSRPRRHQSQRRLAQRARHHPGIERIQLHGQRALYPGLFRAHRHVPGRHARHRHVLSRSLQYEPRSRCWKAPTPSCSGAARPAA